MRVRSAARPPKSKRSILVSHVDPEILSRLKRRGLRSVASTGGTVGPQIVRLALPAGLSVAAAEALIRSAKASATTAADTYYYTQDHDEGSQATCPGVACDMRTLVGWTEPDDDEDDGCASAPVIGLVDTRVDTDLLALKGQDIEVLAPTGTGSDSDHGSAMASLLVGRPHGAVAGLLPHAKLIAVDAFSRAGVAQDRSDVLSLVRAIEALKTRGVKVIALSLAGPANPLLQAAIDAAVADGTLIVAAAGNEGPAASPVYPAAYSGVIAVTAVDRNLAIYRRANRGSYIDIAAPGVEVPVATSGGDVTLRSGTSYAVPFVTAAAAALSVGRSAASVRALLDDAALDLGPRGRDPTFGQGLLQMSAVCVVNPTPPPTAADAGGAPSAGSSGSLGILSTPQ